jgi:bifunctional UDP-N-acetylglucosamine pyrophosphorylase/glucosamine-1-phosphate N-acetyltransferase
MEEVAALILAAGKGTRMNEGRSSPIPKVMFEVGGKPIIRYSVDTVKRAGIKDITVVVGYKRRLIRAYLDAEVDFAVQEPQLGTGHAVAAAKEQLVGRARAVVVLYGDHPLFKPTTIRRALKRYELKRPTILAVSATVADPVAWGFGRIIRNEKGELLKIKEQKDCSPEELSVRELNTGPYVFDGDWLWAHVDRLSDQNVQQEFYLTDLIDLAKREGRKVIAENIASEEEALGINTPKMLERVDKILAHRRSRPQ